ncbi:MAG: HD domain-containing protein [Candidatus Woesearchaeota archaeon]
MDPYIILDKYLKKGSKAYNVIVPHSALVAKKALEVADRVPELNPNKKFIEEIALLHDVGICYIGSSLFGTNGNHRYIEHGILGADLLRKEGYPQHALAVERHIGVGITQKQIEEENLPLPKRDMIPSTVEEEILAFADNFFSKTKSEKLTVSEIMDKLESFGKDKSQKFKEWCIKFKEPIN